MDEAGRREWGIVNPLLPGLAIAAMILLASGHPSIASPVRAVRPATTAALPVIAAEAPTDRPTRRTPRHIARWSIGLILAVVIGPVPMAAGLISLSAAVRLRRIAEQRRTKRNIDRDIPEVLDLVVLLLEAGLTIGSVVQEVGRRGPASTRPAFNQVAHRMDLGEPFADAIVELRTRLGSGAVALVDLVTASHRYGLPMTQVVGQLSAESRAARQRRNEALARALPIKLSFPLVVCTLPSFVLLAIVPAVIAALTSLGSEAW